MNYETKKYKTLNLKQYDLHNNSKTKALKQVS